MTKKGKNPNRLAEYAMFRVKKGARRRRVSGVSVASERQASKKQVGTRRSNEVACDANALTIRDVWNVNTLRTNVGHHGNAAADTYACGGDSTTDSPFSYGWKAFNANYSRFMQDASQKYVRLRASGAAPWISTVGSSTCEEQAFEDSAEYDQVFLGAELWAWWSEPSVRRIRVSDFSVKTSSAGELDYEANDATRQFNELADLLVDDRLAASVFILEKLERVGPGELRDNLTLLAEDTWYDDVDQQRRLVEQLLQSAAHRRNDSDPLADHVVRAAIRRAASLLPVGEIERLYPFLSPSTVNTILPTLVSLVHIIEVEVPEDTVSQKINQRLLRLVEKCADPDVYSHGEVDTMLFAGLVTIAVVNTEDFEKAIWLVRRLNKPYLFRQLREELGQLCEGWKGKAREIGEPRIDAALAAIDRVVL